MNKFYKAESWSISYLDYEVTDEHILAINRVESEQVNALVNELVPVTEEFKLSMGDSLFIYDQGQQAYYCYELLGVEWE